MKFKKTLIISFLFFIICILGYSFYFNKSISYVKNLVSLNTNDNLELELVEHETNSEKSSFDLSFAVFGDIHNNESNFQDAINDIKNNNIKLDALVLNGDTVDQGLDSQYETMNNLLEKNKNNLPKIIIKNIGNHEFYNYDSANKSKDDVNEKIQKYLNFAQENHVYHDKWINGYHFISLGSEDGNSPTSSSTAAYISDEQFNWFKEKLAENYEEGKPIFIFIHQPLILNWGWGDISGTNISDSISKLLSQYPEAIVFNSHTHKQLSEECVDTTNNYTVVQTGAISYTLSINSDNTISRDFSYANGLYVTVSGNNVTIYGRDFKNNKWVFSKDLIFKKQ